MAFFVQESCAPCRSFLSRFIALIAHPVFLPDCRSRVRGTPHACAAAPALPIRAGRIAFASVLPALRLFYSGHDQQESFLQCRSGGEVRHRDIQGRRRAE